jgi:AAA15 family ATPase/GTPase
MKFSSLEIADFRSIIKLDIHNFRQINLITGRNNCGKTTVLEALLQISGMSNPQLPVAINNLRDLVLNSADDFNVYFHNLDFNQEPHISAMLDSAKRSLTIKPKYAVPYTAKVINTEKINLINGNNTIANIDDVPAVTGLVLEFSDGKTPEKFISEISLSDGEERISSKHKEKFFCIFYSPQLAKSALSQQIEKLLINKQMDGIIEALQEIDPKITDIRMGAAGIIYVDIGLEKLLPLNIMGDGIRKILSLLAAVSSVRGGILLVDEIENGLHYSSLETLWKALFKALEVYQVQLFATTHSNECIEAMLSSYNMGDKNADSIRLYRIERQEHKHRVFEYPPEIIASGIDGNIEMR